MIDLSTVTGGAGLAKLAGRAMPVFDVGTSLYDGYTGYSDARAKGETVGQSLWHGTTETIRSFTLYDLWGVSPAY